MKPVFVSVIVPARNEEQAIGGTLASVVAEAADDVEILIVDSESADRTVEVARAGLEHHPGPSSIVPCGRGRGRSMNAGAGVARGRVLMFLHSDTVLPSGWLEALRERVADPETVAGCFQHQFDGLHPMLRVISWIHNLRFRVTGIIYGDQVLFIQAGAFRTLGGFREDQVMEDIEFSERLLQITRPVRIDLTALTSSRKFEQIGVYRAALAHGLRARPAEPGVARVLQGLPLRSAALLGLVLDRQVCCLPGHEPAGQLTEFRETLPLQVHERRLAHRLKGGPSRWMAIPANCAPRTSRPAPGPRSAVRPDGARARRRRRRTRRRRTPRGRRSERRDR
jgi:rSAM/selenodomain-associated transferase 2